MPAWNIGIASLELKLAFFSLFKRPWINKNHFILISSHRLFLEHWSSQKILCNIRQRFSCLLDEWIEKNKICKKNFSSWLFLKSILSVLRCTWTGRINLKIFLGYHINYLSIWPFMCHPWFPARKASKLTFVCFQLQVLNTMQGLKNWSWKQTNVSFQAFLVGNQGWHIKGQMLR